MECSLGCPSRRVHVGYLEDAARGETIAAIAFSFMDFPSIFSGSPSCLCLVGRPRVSLAIYGLESRSEGESMMARMAGRQVEAGAGDTLGAVTGMPKFWLRVEGAASLAAGVALYLHLGGAPLLLVPLILAVDVSMIGYLSGPRSGALTYNLVHNWAAGIVVLALAWWLGSSAIALAGAILVAHTGMDRAAGYGLKYPTAFADTHLGRLGRAKR